MDLLDRLVLLDYPDTMEVLVYLVRPVCLVLMVGKVQLVLLVILDHPVCQAVQ